MTRRVKMADGVNRSPPNPSAFGNGRRDKPNVADSVESAVLRFRNIKNVAKMNLMFYLPNAKPYRPGWLWECETSGGEKEWQTNGTDEHDVTETMRPGRAALPWLGVQLRGRPIESEGTDEFGNVSDLPDGVSTAGRTAAFSGYQNSRRLAGRRAFKFARHGTYPAFF